MVCILIPMFYAVLMVQPRIVFYNYMYEMYIVCIMCTFGCTSQVGIRYYYRKLSNFAFASISFRGPLQIEISYYY